MDLRFWSLWTCAGAPRRWESGSAQKFQLQTKSRFGRQLDLPGVFVSFPILPKFNTSVLAFTMTKRSRASAGMTLPSASSGPKRIPNFQERTGLLKVFLSGWLQRIQNTLDISFRAL